MLHGPPTTELHPCEPPVPLFKAVAQIPFSLAKQAAKTSTAVVISQVRTITADTSMSDGQLQPDANCGIQNAPLQVRAC